MAVVYPTSEDTEILLSFARKVTRFPTQDINLLESTCANLITDAEIVNTYVFSPLFKGVADVYQPLHNDMFPIQYARANILYPAASLPQARGSARPERPSNPRESFRPHETSLRELHNRLRTGKSALKSLNEKYDYAFTVVTLGKKTTSPPPPLQSGASQSWVGQEKKKMNCEEAHVKGEVVAAAEAEEENRGEAEVHHVDTLFVVEAFMRFMFTFDAILAWSSSVVGILDGEGSAPEPGRYVVTDEPNSSEHRTNHVGSIENTAPTNKNNNSNIITNTTTTNNNNNNDNNNNSTDDARDAAKPPSASASRGRTVRVTRYEVHDVQSIYRELECQASLLYRLEYTTYDPRVQRRLLDSAYLYFVHDILRMIGVEIDHLNETKQKLQQQQTVPSTIVFRPSLCEFDYLRQTLHLYWSVCVGEDERTALQYHRMLYQQCMNETVEVMEVLRHIQQPTSSVVGPITPAERAALQVPFESFWRLRGRVLELRDSLSTDIANKNRTHRHRVATRPTPLSLQTGTTLNSNSVTHKVMQRAMRALRSWAKFVACEAELGENPLHDDSYQTTGDGNHRDNFGFKVAMSTTSPLYSAKAKLQRHVLQLTAAVEAQATILEKNFPGAFYRDAKAMWATRANGVMRQLESVSVVFSRPT